MRWSDYSEYVTHFTKPSLSANGGDNLLSILSNCVVHAVNPFGVAKSDAPDISSQRTVCFSEVPFGCLKRISERRSKFGIGFTKKYLKSHGGNPIWYVEAGSKQADAIANLKTNAEIKKDAFSSAIWNLTPFIDITWGDETGSRYRFEWEREWRLIGDLRFNEGDVSFLVLPEDLHESACGFFREARDEALGPYYACPFIDSSWSLDRIQKSIGSNWPHESIPDD